MSLLDYHPITGIWREMNGTNTDGDSGCNEFIDKATGQNITGAYWACGACQHVPIVEGDSSCPACGETVDWDPNNPDHQAI